MIRGQHLRSTLSSIAERDVYKWKKERQRTDHLNHLEKKISRIMKGVEDVQILSNSLIAQNKILHENHVNLVKKMGSQQDQEPVNTKTSTHRPNLQKKKYWDQGMSTPEQY